MGTELPTKVKLGQTLVLMQMTFLNNGRKVGRLVLSRTSCSTLMGVIVGMAFQVCMPSLSAQVMRIVWISPL
jgi:hypothetical protein